LASVELFLNKNGYELSYKAEAAVGFQEEAYSLRLKTYGHYDQHDIPILTKPEDEFTNLCRNFLESRLTKRD
jgi:hypothetical protein